MKPNELDLNALSDAWLAAKAEEQAANARRLDIERAITALVSAPPEEGSYKLESERVKVTVAYKLTRTVDGEALRAAWGDLPENVQSAFRWKAEADVKKLRAMQELTPALYAQACAFVTAKPAKPSVSVEVH
jgi:hypothetical protein